MALAPMPMLTCASVPASRAWYARVLGLVSAHGGDEYDQMASTGPDGRTVVLQLHHLAPDAHAHLVDADRPLGSNGVAVWFETTDYAAATARLAEAQAGGDVAVLLDDHLNTNANHREFWLADPDGYVVVVSSPYGDT